MQFQRTFLTILLTTFSLFGSGLEELQALKGQYRIEEGVLISHQGISYPRIQYDSKLHEDLAYTLKDPDQAKRVHEAYLIHILPFLDDAEGAAANTDIPEDLLYFLKDPNFHKYFENTNYENEEISVKDAFSKGLLEVCILFGHPKFSPKEALINALYHKGARAAQWTAEHDQEISNFVREASLPLYEEKDKRHDKIRIVILTTTASGGNHSVADAIMSFLTTKTNVELILIDNETIANKVEAMKLATGTHTYDGVYSRIFQKSDDFNVIIEREMMNREIHQYIPSMLLKEMKKTILDLNPDLIISTRTYVPDDLALASLGIPFRMIHTNFEVSLFLNNLYGKIPSDYIRFWMPSFDPAVFKSLFHWHHAESLYNEADDYSTLMQKISSFLFVPPALLKSQFQEFGYAVRPDFYPINDEDQLKTLKAKWSIKPDEIPIFVSMGKYGSGAMHVVFNTLRASKTSLNLKYLFICGKNPSLQQELEREVDSRFAIYGALSAKEMNELMNLSKIGISKTGSAASGEALVTNKHLLIMNYYPWEEANAAHLIKNGLATKYDATLPMIDQIEACLKKITVKKPNPYESWREHLSTYLKELFGSRFKVEEPQIHSPLSF